MTKMFYRMGEVCELTGLEPHVVRSWESAFPQLTPKKSRSGHRAFTQQDIDLLIKLKKLIKDQGHTLDGARRALAEKKASAAEEPEVLRHRLKHEIQEIRGVLENVINMLDP